VIVGETYLENGRPVKVLAAWLSPKDKNAWSHRELPRDWSIGRIFEVQIETKKRRGAPRNVIIQREDGSLVARPFRGLRRLEDGPTK